MAKQLVYTSVPRGLWPGTSGYCTVVSTDGIQRDLASVLESLSIYRFREGDPSSSPRSVSYLKVQHAGQAWPVLMQTCDAGLDYSNRRRRLSHYLLLGAHDLTDAGPAWIAEQDGVFLGNWGGQPTLLQEEKQLPAALLGPQHCEYWQQLAGDAGYAGLLAEAIMEGPTRTVLVVCPPHVEALALAREATSLLPVEWRWDATFATQFANLPPNVQCQWRFVSPDVPELATLSTRGDVTLIDLTRQLAALESSPAVDAARQGAMLTSGVSSAQVVVRRPQLPDPAPAVATPEVYEPEAAEPPAATPDQADGWWDSEPPSSTSVESPPAAYTEAPPTEPSPPPPPPPAESLAENRNLPLWIAGGSAGLAVLIAVPILILAFRGGNAPVVTQRDGGSRPPAKDIQPAKDKPNEHDVAPTKDGSSEHAAPKDADQSPKDDRPRNPKDRAKDDRRNKDERPSKDNGRGGKDRRDGAKDGNGVKDGSNQPDKDGGPQDRPQQHQMPPDNGMPPHKSHSNDPGPTPPPTQDEQDQMAADRFLAGLVKKLDDVSYIPLPSAEKSVGARDVTPLSDPARQLTDRLTLRLTGKSLTGVWVTEPLLEEDTLTWEMKIRTTAVDRRIGVFRLVDGQLGFLWEPSLNLDEILFAESYAAMSLIRIEVVGPSQLAVAESGWVQLFRPAAASEFSFDAAAEFRGESRLNKALILPDPQDRQRLRPLSDFARGENRVNLDVTPRRVELALTENKDYFADTQIRPLLPYVDMVWSAVSEDAAVVAADQPILLRLAHLEPPVKANFSQPVSDKTARTDFKFDRLENYITQLEKRAASAQVDDTRQRIEELLEFHQKLRDALETGKAACQVAPRFTVNCKGEPITFLLTKK